jgi:RNA polymerase sigma-70 factor (sigma-E family)
VSVGGDHRRTGIVRAEGVPVAADSSASSPSQRNAPRQPAARARIGPQQQATSVPEPRRGAQKLLGNVAVVERVAPVPAARNGQRADPDDQTRRACDSEFRDYVRARRHALLRSAYLLTGNVADAEDLVQSALAKTYLAWHRIEDRAALDGYVRRAIVNTHISWWRRRRVEEYPTDELPDQAVADHAVNSDLQETLRRAVDRLPGRMRAAIMLRYYDDMTEAEVAEVLGISIGTVKSMVARAVAKLRIDAELLAD